MTPKDLKQGTRRLVRRPGMWLAGLDDRKDLLQRVVSDHQVRRAVSRTASRARDLRHNVNGSDLSKELGRLARDRQLQEQVAGLLRAVTSVLDAGVSVGKRRARHRIGRFLLVSASAGGAALLAVRAARQSQAAADK